MISCLNLNFSLLMLSSIVTALNLMFCLELKFLLSTSSVTRAYRKTLSWIALWNLLWILWPIVTLCLFDQAPWCLTHRCGQPLNQLGQNPKSLNVACELSMHDKKAIARRTPEIHQLNSIRNQCSQEQPRLHPVIRAIRDIGNKSELQCPYHPTLTRNQSAIPL